jgi:hypothetical protein
MSFRQSDSREFGIATRNLTLLKIEISRRSPDNYRDLFVEMTKKQKQIFAKYSVFIYKLIIFIR